MVPSIVLAPQRALVTRYSGETFWLLSAVLMSGALWLFHANEPGENEGDQDKSRPEKGGKKNKAERKKATDRTFQPDRKGGVLLL